MKSARNAAPASREEIIIAVIARLLASLRHVAVGVLSPIPGAAALLAQAQSSTNMTVSVLGSRSPKYRTLSGVDLFDCAGQGRLDAFFLSGGQIDGAANVNLVGTGDYPLQDTRWSGSFGSAYLYFMVPNVILFRERHDRRTLVEKVDFVSAPGTSAPGIYRPGGPVALVTDLCAFSFDRSRGRFRLETIHGAHDVGDIRARTGFDFDADEPVPATSMPTDRELNLMRTEVARKLADPYPAFAARHFGI